MMKGRVTSGAVWDAVLTDAEIKALAEGAPPQEIRSDRLVVVIEKDA